MTLRSFLAAGCLLMAVLAQFTTAARAAEASIELEVVMAPGFPAIDAQKWLETFKAAGLTSVRISAARGGEQPGVTRDGQSVRVVGVLAGGGVLRVPGGTFSRDDSARLADWATKIKAPPADPATGGKTLPFGLSAKELVATQEALASPLTFRTKGEKIGALLPKIARLTPLAVRYDETAGAALAETTAPDELEGVAAGTALAALVRPQGLVVVPRKAASGAVELAVVGVRESPQSWPIGWPSDKPPKDLLPALFNNLEVEVKNTPLVDATAAIAQRLKAPLLFDYNGLARQQIDIEKFQPAFPLTKTYYKRVLDRILYQAKLQCELRTDDGGKPLLWVSPLKQ